MNIYMCVCFFLSRRVYHTSSVVATGMQEEGERLLRAGAGVGAAEGEGVGVGVGVGAADSQRGDSWSDSGIDDISSSGSVVGHNGDLERRSGNSGANSVSNASGTYAVQVEAIATRALAVLGMYCTSTDTGTGTGIVWYGADSRGRNTDSTGSSKRDRIRDSVGGIVSSKLNFNKRHLLRPAHFNCVLRLLSLAGQ